MPPCLAASRRDGFFPQLTWSPGKKTRPSGTPRNGHYNIVVPFTLAYDDLPPGSDLLRDITTDFVTITATAPEPSTRARHWARRSAAYRAVADVLLIVPPFLIVPTMLIAASRPYFAASLPPVIYPLLGIFVAAIYLLAWKWRYDHRIDAIHKARAQTTFVSASSAELHIEITGPLGDESHRIESQIIGEIHPQRPTFQEWWRFALPSLRIHLRDGRRIDIMRGRDESELAAIAANLRRVLGVPKNAMALP